ncbi:centrosomal protein of 89 kDa [Engraulis encrasicolus]|uniref:centrosomal protein of 89 kDa n=1 Tax=Engraulis encrasicolus TaxID=184585 RepID=UPI002FD3CBD2
MQFDKMSKFNFSFRRSERKAFKHIAHGLIPAATIAPRPAVPRTPPPRSPSPSPERPRSALAAAILSSSLTGRTVAIPPPSTLTHTRTRSLSESDTHSRSEHSHAFQPFATTALYTRDQWSVPVGSRSRHSSPGRSGEEEEEEEEEEHDEDDDEDVEEEEEEEEEREDRNTHIYQTVDDNNTSPVYAIPHKKSSHSEPDDLTGESTFDVVSPLHTEEEVEEETREKRSSPPQARLSSPPQPRSPTSRHTHTHSSSKAMPSAGVCVERAEVKDTSRKQPKKSPELTSATHTHTRTDSSRTEREEREALRRRCREVEEERDALRRRCDERKEERDALRRRCKEVEEERNGLRRRCEEQREEREALKRRCEEQSRLLQNTQQQLLLLQRENQSENRTHTELECLRVQAQELVDENDALKMTVHRLSVQLSTYQNTHTQQVSKSAGLPGKGPPPPWLLDVKYLSPLAVAYEDRLTEKDTLLKTCQEEVCVLRARTEEVVKENQRLHQEMEEENTGSRKEWRQLQDQCRLVLDENRILLEQLDTQQKRTRDTHTRHTHEVAKVCKQLVLREQEVCVLRGELEEVKRELHTLQHQEALTHTQHQADIAQLSHTQHQADLAQLSQRVDEENVRWQLQVDELVSKMAALQAERKSLALDKSQSDAANKGLEAELDISRHAHKKLQRRVEGLKQQLEQSMDKELEALQYLSGVVGLAEHTTQQRDQLIHMASTLEKGKQDVVMRIIQGTMQLAKLQEKLKVYRREAASSVCVLGRRLVEQEQAMEGHTHTFQQERRHLQGLLRDKQHALDTALQQKREVQCELDAVWECVSRESQKGCQVTDLESPPLVAPSNAPSLDWTPPHGSPVDFYS